MMFIVEISCIKFKSEHVADFFCLISIFWERAFFLEYHRIHDSCDEFILQCVYVNSNQMYFGLDLWTEVKSEVQYECYELAIRNFYENEAKYH